MTASASSPEVPTETELPLHEGGMGWEVGLHH